MSYIRLQRLRELAEKRQQTLNVNRLLPLTYASLNFSSCKLTALFYLESPLCIRFKTYRIKYNIFCFSNAHQQTFISLIKMGSLNNTCQMLISKQAA